MRFCSSRNSPDFTSTQVPKKKDFVSKTPKICFVSGCIKYPFLLKSPAQIGLGIACSQTTSSTCEDLASDWSHPNIPFNDIPWCTWGRDWSTAYSHSSGTGFQLWKLQCWCPARLGRTIEGKGTSRARHELGSKLSYGSTFNSGSICK